MYVLQLHHPKTEDIVGTVCARPNDDEYKVWSNVTACWDQFLDERLNEDGTYQPFDIEGFVYYMNTSGDFSNLAIYTVNLEYYQPSHPPIQ